MVITADVTLRETRSASSSARKAYAADLRAGSIIPVYTNGSGQSMVADYSNFWLAIVKPKGKRNTNKVTYAAVANDEGWDIKKGSTEVLNVQWLERRSDDQRLFSSNGEMQTIALESVLTHRIAGWEETNAKSRKKATLMRLKLEDEVACVELCRAVKLTKSNWEVKSDEESESDGNGNGEGAGAGKRKEPAAEKANSKRQKGKQKPTNEKGKNKRQEDEKKTGGEAKKVRRRK